MRMRNILIVHDSKPVRNLLSMYTFAEMEDALPYGAANGREGLELMQKTRFDVVVCANRMEGMSGIEVAREIRKLPQGKDTPFVLLTATLNGEIKDAMARNHIDHCLEVPFEAPALAVMINQVCNPVQWRTSRRVSIPGMGVRLRVNGKMVEGSPINISQGGISLEMNHPGPGIDLLTGAVLSLEFPGEYNAEPVEEIPIRLLQMMVAGWNPDGRPGKLRTVWQFVKPAERAVQTLNWVFEQLETPNW
ncbi:MAG: response regulator [Deltaproteobacteria bacterium]|nr:response regulator [Deltaproteobacteria bacterium]